MKRQSITVNYILNTAYQVLTLITPIVTAPYISRVLGAEGVGVYSYTSAVVAFFGLFAVLGTTVYGQRTIAQCRDDKSMRSKNFWEIELLSLLSTAVCLAAWFIFILISPEYKFIFLIFTIELLSKGFDISWFYAGLERFSFIVVRNTVIKIAGVLLLFLLVKNSDQVWVYIAILSVSNFLGNISMWLPLRKLVSRIRLRDVRMKEHFRQTMIYFVPTIAASVYTYLDKVMIGWFTEGTSENGYYEQANRIIKIGYTVLISLNTVMSSRMSYLFALSKEKEIKNKLENALAFIITIGLPVVCGISCIAANFVPWFFGEGFEKVIFLMILSSPLVIILSMHNFLSSQYLVPSGQRARSTKGVFIGAAVNFCLNLCLVPFFQSVGAVIATLIAETSICVVYFYMSRDYVPPKLILKYLPKQLIAAAAMSAVVIIIGSGHRGSILITVVQIIAGGAVYFGALLLLREKFILGFFERVLQKIKR